MSPERVSIHRIVTSLAKHARASRRAWRAACVVAVCAGCHTTTPGWKTRLSRPDPAPTLGAVSDDFWARQAHSAEASDYIVYGHEFKSASQEITPAAGDHLKQIAARLLSGGQQLVIVERSMHSEKSNAKYGYPVYPDPDLDMKRRAAVVAVLESLGVPDADQRVVVAPALSDGLTATEAEAAYRRGIQSGFTGGAFGGGFGGFGGFGGSGGGAF